MKGKGGNNGHSVVEGSFPAVHHFIMSSGFEKLVDQLVYMGKSECFANELLRSVKETSS